MYVLFCVFCSHHTNWHPSATLTEFSSVFFLSCKANARVHLAKTGHACTFHSEVVNCAILLLIVLFCVLFVCKSVLY
jgi:hypothetical protein